MILDMIMIKTSLKCYSIIVIFSFLCCSNCDTKLYIFVHEKIACNFNNNNNRTIIFVIYTSDRSLIYFLFFFFSPYNSALK